jgi:hypothetical protein
MDIPGTPQLVPREDAWQWSAPSGAYWAQAPHRRYHPVGLAHDPGMIPRPWGGLRAELPCRAKARVRRRDGPTPGDTPTSAAVLASGIADATGPVIRRPYVRSTKTPEWVECWHAYGFCYQKSR